MPKRSLTVPSTRSLRSRPVRMSMTAYLIRRRSPSRCIDLVLTGSMQREGERLRIKDAVIDIRTGLERSDLVDGTVNDLFGIQDRVADSVAVTLNLGTPLIKTAPIDPSVSQREILEAVGYLRRYDD